MDEQKLIQILIDNQDKMNEIHIKSIEATNELNKRLIIGWIISILSMCLLIGTICVTYFTADYGYLEANQISNNYSENNTNSIGGND
jgi:hypothetical protein